MLDRFENLHATVTPHHLIITLDDVAGGMLQPHLFCKPIAKRPEDREALRGRLEHAVAKADGYAVTEALAEEGATLRTAAKAAKAEDTEEETEDAAPAPTK